MKPSWTGSSRSLSCTTSLWWDWHLACEGHTLGCYVVCKHWPGSRTLTQHTLSNRYIISKWVCMRLSCTALHVFHFFMGEQPEKHWQIPANFTLCIYAVFARSGDAKNFSNIFWLNFFIFTVLDVCLITSYDLYSKMKIKKNGCQHRITIQNSLVTISYYKANRVTGSVIPLAPKPGTSQTKCNTAVCV